MHLGRNKEYCWFISFEKIFLLQNRRLFRQKSTVSFHPDKSVHYRILVKRIEFLLIYPGNIGAGHFFMVLGLVKEIVQYHFPFFLKTIADSERKNKRHFPLYFSYFAVCLRHVGFCN